MSRAYGPGDMVEGPLEPPEYVDNSDRDNARVEAELDRMKDEGELVHNAQRS